MKTAALWKEAEGSNEVVTDLTGGKSQHSQQGLTGKWSIASPGDLWRVWGAGIPGTLQTCQPEALSRTGSLTKKKLPGVESKFSRKEVIQMNEREGQMKVERNLPPCDCNTVPQQLEKKKVMSSHEFHIIIRENFSKKCSSRFICRYQPELGHMPLPEPITVKWSETPWLADTNHNSSLEN